MGKKRTVVKCSYYVAVRSNKVIFLGSDFHTVMDRANKEVVDDMHNVYASSYREAAYIAAESHYLQISEEVQNTIKLLRGYNK